MTTAESSLDLAAIRRKIDAVDSAIITLLAQRTALVREAGKFKKNDQAVRDPRRVEEVVEKARARAAIAGLSPDIAERVYRAMIAGFIEQEMKEFRERSGMADS